MIEAKSGEEFTVGWKSLKRDRRRILLRPHGSGGRVSRLLPDYGEGTLHIWTNGQLIWRTRAQAAQAVYEGGRSEWTEEKEEIFFMAGLKREADAE